jgi:hypothetical protein
MKSVFIGFIHYDPVTDVWQYWGYGSTANNWPGVIGFCEQVSIQSKPAGGYDVWVDGGCRQQHLSVFRPLQQWHPG